MCNISLNTVDCFVEPSLQYIWPPGVRFAHHLTRLFAFVCLDYSSLVQKPVLASPALPK